MTASVETWQLFRPKPAFGSPCNGCGVCCIAVQCPLSTAIFGDAELCPALEAEGDGFACGLIRNPSHYLHDLPKWSGSSMSEAFAVMLGAGTGCDGQGEDEQVSAATRQRMMNAAEAAIANASPTARALARYMRGGKDAA